MAGFISACVAGYFVWESAAFGGFSKAADLAAPTDPWFYGGGATLFLLLACVFWLEETITRLKREIKALEERSK